MEAKYISTKELAVYIRKGLAQRWPGQVFSVKSDSYAGGSSVRVGWTDGPSESQVRRFTDPLDGEGFDGMIDMAYYNRHWQMPDGSIVYAGTDGTQGSMGVVAAHKLTKPAGAVEVNIYASVSTSRHESPDMVRAALTYLCTFAGWDVPEVPVREWRWKGKTTISHDFDPYRYCGWDEQRKARDMAQAIHHWDATKGKPDHYCADCGSPWQLTKQGDIELCYYCQEKRQPAAPIVAALPVDMEGWV